MKPSDIGLEEGDKIVFGHAPHPHGDRLLSLASFQEAYGRDVPCDVVVMAVPKGKGQKVIDVFKEMSGIENKESTDGD